MTAQTPDSREDVLKDPIAQRPQFSDTESKVAIFGHPIHAMSVAFPIALTFGVFGADVLYWWTGDDFWARAGLWSVGFGFILGLFAGVSGTAELILVPGIRSRAAAWSHFLLAVFLLALLGTNWGLRLDGYETAVLPYGLLLSFFCVVVVSATGWHGGKLVFDYRLGTSKGK